jgi:hypothetical protein
MSQKITVTEHMLNTSNMTHLEEVLDFIDMLHTVASDGDLPNFAEMDEAELMNVLRDIVYTAQETISELESARAKKRQKRQRKQPLLRIVPKVEKAG